MPNPGYELELAVEGLQKWYKHFPTASVCNSNHSSRIYKKALHHGLPRQVLKEYKKIIECPNTWEYEDTFEVDSVIYHHGDSFNNTSWRGAMNRLRQSSVCGHQHSLGGVQYSASNKQRLFSCNAGALIDAKAMAFNYASRSIERVTLGSAIIIDGETCLFVPMNEKGRLCLPI